MAQHSIIFGRTESGKTFLARILAHKSKERGRGVLILDPLDAGHWNGRVCNDIQEFLEAAKSQNGLLLIVDESGTAIGKYETDADWLTTTARHYGHTSIVVCHSLRQLSVTLRDNVTCFYAFAGSPKDAERVAECVQDAGACREIPTLNKGELIIFPVYGKAIRARIDFKTGRIISR